MWLPCATGQQPIVCADVLSNVFFRQSVWFSAHVWTNERRDSIMHARLSVAVSAYRSCIDCWLHVGRYSGQCRLESARCEQTAQWVSSVVLCTASQQPLLHRLCSIASASAAAAVAAGDAAADAPRSRYCCHRRCLTGPEVSIRDEIAVRLGTAIRRRSAPAELTDVTVLGRRRRSSSSSRPVGRLTNGRPRCRSVEDTSRLRTRSSTQSSASSTDKVSS